MAFGRLQRTPAPKPIGDINMTPLIDVMLVLLVIFMVAAPLMGSSSLRLDLPKSEAASPGEATEPLVVSLGAGGELQLGREPIAPDALQRRIEAVARLRPDTEVQLRADQTVPYGRVAELIGRVQQAGLNRIAFAAEPAGRR